MGIIPEDGTATEDEFAISPKWEAHKDFRKPFKYQVETSGQKLLLRRLDMPDLMKQGIANEMDFMTKGLMSTPVKEGQKPKEVVNDIIQLSENFQKMEVMVNKVCLAGILKPKIHPIPVVTRTEDGKTVSEPIPLDSRQPGLFYVDNIPWDDRQELFAVIFETDGISDFREEQEPGVGDVADVQSVQLPADEPVADVRPSESEGILSQ